MDNQPKCCPFCGNDLYHMLGDMNKKGLSCDTWECECKACGWGGEVRTVILGET